MRSSIIAFIGAIFLATPLLAQKSYMDPSTYISYKDDKSGILFALDKVQMEPYLYKPEDTKGDPAVKKITENEFTPAPRLLELYKGYVDAREEWNNIKNDKKADKNKKAKIGKNFETAGDHYLNMLYDYADRTDVNPVIQILSLAQLQILNENYYYGSATKDAAGDLADIIKIYTNYKTDNFPNRIKQYNKKMPSDTADEIMAAVDATIEKKMEGKRPAVTSELNKKDKK